MDDQSHGGSHRNGRSTSDNRHREAPTEKRQLRERLAESDLEFVRVLEDLIATLIEKRVILLTDLPVAAQRKLSDRLDLRSQLTSLERIVADSDDVMLP